jgi:hypothetical protein
MRKLTQHCFIGQNNNAKKKRKRKKRTNVVDIIYY